MNIFFDARWTRVDTIDGPSRYGASLATALHKLYPITLIIFDKRQLRLFPEGIPYILVNHPFSPRELLIARTLNRQGADVVFSPLQVMGFWGRRYKLIFTLQDMIYYHHPQAPTFLPLPVRILWRLFHMAYWPQRLLLNRADRVVTVSHTSKKYIEEARLTRRPVEVVYNAPLKLENPPKTPKNPTRDIVYMGSFMPYKNAELLIAGMKDLPEYTLHLLSKISPERKKELKKLIPKGAKVKFWNGISDEDYEKLLVNAWVLATASRDEGFGLPIIEAMNLGVPVVCSNIEIFHEVGGDAALYFSPDSPKEFVKCVRQLEDAKIRQASIRKGKTQATRFDWNVSARTLLESIEKITPKK
jgi:glycosyltransferase involved in cell wall biosynthesis